ncbi:hypothetical protein BS329_04440 [Amycolatopsis coloradensis]|uniref:DUF6779 domain-containing protein n=1 Tax=Amycolatopsis coloradensis TaxID=76021 RepID=A0A1R0L0F4_9PSEU|nr:DUF6779 domain-containing protein [Amycolatopsis coloradensis]OLZ55265.1 hypothetical protein BS329_04440 [Amycolatopsis coloradensis]
MTGVGDDSRGRLAGRPWLVVGLVLAVGATLALVLSDDLRYLRLGIVAALWAALIGAFLAVRYRKNVSQSEDAVAEAQAVYELELEREIAARREFELEMEAETRQAAETRSQDELEALRAEVSALRESLQSLFGGGEVLLERVALTAQATRMRSLDNKQLMSAGSENGNGKPQLMAAKSTTIDVDERDHGRERPTELIDRVLEPASARNGAPAAARRKPSNGQVNGTNGYGQNNQVPRPKPVDESTRRSMRKADARASKAAEALAAEAARRERLELSNPGMSPAEVSRPMPKVDAKRKTPPPVTPAEVSRPSMPGVSRAEVSQPSMPTVARQPQRPDPQRPEAQRSEAQRQEPQRQEPQRRPQQQPSLQQRLDAGTAQRPSAPRPEEQTRKQAPPVKPAAQAKPVKKVEPDRPRPNRELGLTRPGMKPVDRPRPAGGTPPPANKPTPEPMEATGEWKPSWTQERPVSDLSAAFPRKDDFQDRLRPAPPSKPQPASPQPAGSQQRPQPAGSPPRRDPEPPTPLSIPVVAEPVRPPEPEPVRRPAAETPSRHSGGAEEPPAVNPTLPEELRVTQNRSGGRRRRASDDSSVSLTPVPQVPEPTGGGRRRRPDGEPPAWQSTESSGGRHGGKRAKPEDEAPSRNGSSHSRPETPDAGSHASGRSVMDLLAANGANESTPRRRRRAED